jgi:hypothetical protein
MLIQVYLPKGNTYIIFSYLLITFAFPQVLAGIYTGQVTFLVFFGLVTCMFLIKKQHWYWAGAVLILTSIKPHLVVLQVIYLLIYISQKRQYRGWVGICLAGIICLVVLFTLRPELATDLVGLSKIAPTSWYTPTVGGLLSFLGMTEITRYLIVLFLPIPFILAKQREKFSLEFSVALLTLITIPFTFFGWSYDQAILLIPVAQVFNWLNQSKIKQLKTAIPLMIIIGIGISYYQKTVGVFEVYYIWIPLFWSLIFCVTWYYSTRSKYNHEQTTS